VRPWDPERIGPYAIVSRLGAGAMGQVYLARSAAGRLVAIKTIKPELAEEEGFRTRFAQEVAAARRVSGFFTAAVVEADPDADVPWLATAYVPAPSLRRMVQVCGPLPPVTVRWLAAGCAEALESIHAVGLVHMDLKPSNVLVATDGPRVIDFGVARSAGRIGFAPQHGPVGTPAYMAPEQARDIRQVSPASDVFSLGATLLYAATGHPPYSGETTAEVLIRLANELPDLTDLPAELTGLVTACLDRDPKRRPTSATVLARVGQFTENRSYLPESAQALIGQYEPGRVGDTDETAPSIPALPDKARPESPPLDSWAGMRSWPLLRRRLRMPAWAGWSIAGAGLVTVGVLLGATLTSSGSPPGDPTNDSPGGTVNMPPPVGPTCGQQAAAAGGPAICVVQPEAVQGTVFTIRFSGFQPGTRAQVKLLYYPPPTSPGGPFPAPRTLRSYTVAANSQLKLGGSMRPGLYKVTGSGAAAVFGVESTDGGGPGGPPGP
jgi:serine/threonine protein kinase